MQAGGHVHDYGVASLPYVPRYEHGGVVAFVKGGGDGEPRSPEEQQRMDDAILELRMAESPEARAAVPEAERQALGIRQNQRIATGEDVHPIWEKNKFQYIPAQANGPGSPAMITFGEPKPKLPPSGTPYVDVFSPDLSSEGVDKLTKNAFPPGSNLVQPNKTDGITSEPVSPSNSSDLMTLLNNIGANSGVGGKSNYPNLIPGIEERKQLALDYLEDAKKFAPPKETYASIAAERKAAQGANPNYDPDYFKNRNALLEERYKEQQKGFAPSAMNNLAMALSAAGAEGSFGRGIAAFGKSINEGNVRFSKEIKDARDHFQNQKDLNDAAKQAEANNDITSAMQLKAKSEEDNRQFLAKQREAEYQALHNTSKEKDAAKLSEAEFNQKQAIADRAVNLRLNLAKLSLAGNISAKEMTYAVELAKLREKGKLTPKELAPIMAKLMPEINEQAAQDARTLGFEFEKLPSDKQQQLRNAAGGKVRDRLLSLSGVAPAVSGNTITGITPGAPTARPSGIAGLGLGSGMVDVAAENLGEDEDDQ
jgi:hypothetical protein